MLLHRDPGDDHPEQPARLESIIQRLQDSDLLHHCVHVPAGKLPEDVLASVHTLQHLKFMANLKEMDSMTILKVAHSMDSIYLCEASEISAKVAASCALNIACEIARGNLKNGFALVRPPGHHAEPDQAMGFCLYNNVAIATKELQRQRLAKRIMILDWDVHHGNGTQKVFVADPDVLFISIHRYDDGKFYPSRVEGSPQFVGEEPAMGKTVNIGWNGPGAGDPDYFAAFLQIVLPIAEEFGPDFVIVSAGFDAAEGDPIGLCEVSPRGFAQMTQFLMGIADGKLMLVLEGGYNVPIVADCAEACMRTLMGEPLGARSTTDSGPSVDATAAMGSTLIAHRPYWKSLRPRCHSIPMNLPDVVPLSLIMETFWKNQCTRNFKLIPMPIADDELRKTFTDRVFISDHILSNPPCIVVFAHESGQLFSGNIESNIVDPHSANLFSPFESFLEDAAKEKWAIVDVCVPTHKWELKQTHTGSADDLLALNDLLMYIWDYFLALSETQNIIFVSFGLPAYSVCNLIDKRMIKHKVRALIVVSPTLYLPVASVENAKWYQENSLILIPTKRPEGTPITTNPSFGSCISSGTDDSSEISFVISRNKNRIFQFIHHRLVFNSTNKS